MDPVLGLLIGLLAGVVIGAGFVLDILVRQEDPATQLRVTLASPDLLVHAWRAPLETPDIWEAWPPEGENPELGQVDYEPEPGYQYALVCESKG